MGERIGYVRISTTKQNTAKQEEIMKEWNVDRIFKEKVSGKDTERKELKKLMEHIRSGDVIIVESYSRFARSTKDLLQLLGGILLQLYKFMEQKIKTIFYNVNFLIISNFISFKMCKK